MGKLKVRDMASGYVLVHGMYGWTCGTYGIVEYSYEGPQRDTPEQAIADALNKRPPPWMDDANGGEPC
jgi:hypothetical protein